MTERLILASASPFRRKMLENAGITVNDGASARNATERVCGAPAAHFSGAGSAQWPEAT